MKHPERPAPADLVREARKCDGEAAYWTVVANEPGLSGPFLVHAAGRAGYWEHQARRWEAAARAACGPLRWAWWCWWNCPRESRVAWPERAPVSPERRYT